MASLFKIYLTTSSLSLALIVFAIKNNKYLYYDFASYFAYCLGALLFARVGLFLTQFLSNDSIEQGSIESIEPANDSFLPSYLGYFFVALSINDVEVFCWVFGLIFIFIFYSKISYFNPIFFILGYNFYYLVNNNRVKILVITKRELKKPSDVEFETIKRINNYTFINKE